MALEQENVVLALVIVDQIMVVHKILHIVLIVKIILVWLQEMMVSQHRSASLVQVIVDHVPRIHQFVLLVTLAMAL